MFLWAVGLGCTTSVPEQERTADAAPDAYETNDHLGEVGDHADHREPTDRTHHEAPTTAAAPGNGECPEGVVAAPGWPGEYPSPVVDLTRPMTAKGRANPCDTQPTVSCQLEPGLYHPWVGAEDDYVTVRGVERYQATGKVKIGNHKVKPGTIVEMTQDVGEGYCQYRIDGETFQAQCPQLITHKLERVASETRDPVQLMRVACTGATQRAWVTVNDAMMALPEVREGAILGYGKVGHAGEKPSE